MGMLRLAPEIQEHILSMPETIRRPAITERAPRSITMFDDKHHQLQALADILSKYDAIFISMTRQSPLRRCRSGRERR